MASPLHEESRGQHAYARRGQMARGLMIARCGEAFGRLSRAVPANRVVAPVLAVGLLPVAMQAVFGSGASPVFGGQGAEVLVLVASSAIASLLLAADALLHRGDRRGEAGTQVAPQERGLDLAHPATRQPADDVRDDARFTSLIASVEHDLRTPLNAIIGFSDLMQQELHGPLGSDRYHSYAGHIRDSGLVLLGAVETTIALTQRLSRDGEGQAGLAVSGARASAHVAGRVPLQP
jgi:signal transduction histidine kinase